MGEDERGCYQGESSTDVYSLYSVRMMVRYSLPYCYHLAQVCLTGQPIPKSVVYPRWGIPRRPPTALSPGQLSKEL